MSPLPTERAVAVAVGAALLALGGLAAPALFGLALVVDAALLLLVVLEWRGRPADAVKVSRDAPARAAVAAPLTLSYTLSTRGPRLSTVELHDTWPPSLRGTNKASGRGVTVDQPLTLSLQPTPERRGTLELGELRLRFTTGLGLLVHRLELEQPAQLRILPSLTAGGDALRQLERLGASGERRTRQRGDGSEFDALRPYRVGDALRDIDWKATARSNRPVSRSYTVEKNHDVLLIVDTGRLMGARSGGQSKLDHVVEAVLALAWSTLKVGDRVGLVAFDSGVWASVAPGRGPEHLGRVVEAASDLQPRAAETDFIAASGWLGVHQRKRALLIFFTDFVDQLTAGPMITSLMTLRRRHPCLFVAVEDPELGDTLSARPDALEDLHEKAVAYTLDTERRVVLETLRRAGVSVVSSRPEGLTGPSINAYLDLRNAAFR